MKNFRKVGKFIVMPMVFVYLFVSAVSCSRVETVSDNEVLLETSSKNAAKSIAFFNEIKVKYENSEVSRNGELTQEVIDEYLVNAGYPAGAINVNTVLQIISKTQEAQSMGLEVYINSTNYSAYTKAKLIAMQNGAIQNLHLQPQFLLLPIGEKQLLLAANSLIANAAGKYGNVPCPSDACCAAILITGIGIGSGLGGVLGGIIGGVVGLIACSSDGVK